MQFNKWLPHYFYLARFTEEGTFQWLSHGVKCYENGKVRYRNAPPHWEDE